MRPLTGAMFLGVLAAACPVKDPPTDGTLVVKMRITAPPLGDLSSLSSVEFKASRIEVVHRAVESDPATETVVIVDPTERTATIEVQEGNVVILAALTVPQGFVTQVRFVSSSVTATMNGGPRAVKLPSGEQTGLKFVPEAPLASFQIKPKRHTDVEGQFDPNARLVLNRGQGLILKPTVPTIDVTPQLDAADAPPQFVAHQAYVLFAEGTAAQTIAQIHAGTGATLLRRNARHPWDVVSLPTTLAEVDAVAYYSGKGEVRLATLNYNSFGLNAFPEEWPKGTDGSPTTRQWWLVKTESPGAWDVRANGFTKTTGGSHFPIVAIVDTDINVFNRDLQENIFINQLEIPSAVGFDIDCKPLSAPLPLNTIHTTPPDASEPDDNLITLADVNRSPNREAYNTILRQVLSDPLRPLDSRIDLSLLVAPDPSFAAPHCGLWENMQDDDANGHADDIVGWDFVRDANLSLESVPTAGSGAGQSVSLRDGTSVTNAGHGFAVAGVLGAVNNSSSFSSAQSLAADYVGQAWRVRILPARVLGAGEGVSAGALGTIHAGLEYVKSLNADIINMSFSSICAPDRDEIPVNLRCKDSERQKKLDSYRASFVIAGLDQDALITVGPIDAALDLDAPDVQDMPAELLLPNQINVTSTQQEDKHGSALATCPGGQPKSAGISWGVKTYQLAAPGRCMFVLNYGGAGPLSAGVDSEPTGGTSLSAPQVAGVASLILAAEPNLRGQPAEIRARILRNADVIEGLKTKVAGGKRLNARKAVTNEVP